MPVITKELAERIAKKLEAQVVRRGKRPHDLAQVFHKGKIVAFFGIRRSSKKDKGHDHIPSDIYVSPRQAKLLGQCPLSREEWLVIMAEKGKL